MLFCLGKLPTFTLALVTLLGAGGTANPDLGPLAGLDTLGTIRGLTISTGGGIFRRLALFLSVTFPYR